METCFAILVLAASLLPFASLLETAPRPQPVLVRRPRPRR